MNPKILLRILSMLVIAATINGCTYGNQGPITEVDTKRPEPNWIIDNQTLWLPV